MKTIVKDDGYGQRRLHVLIICEFCSVDFWTPKRYFLRSKRHFCSSECHNKVQKNEGNVTLTCATCGDTFRRRKGWLKSSKSGIYFCSVTCKNRAARVDGGIPEIQPEFYGTGETAYRKKAFANYPHKCERCGYDEEPKILEAHHLDSDRENNAVENLMLLCCNCHRLVTRGFIQIQRGHSMSKKLDSIVKDIGELSVTELVELISILEDTFNVSSKPPEVVIQGGVPAEEVEEQFEFDVILTSVGTSKIPVLKVIREITKMGLREVKGVVDNLPGVIKEQVDKQEAESIKGRIEAVGGEVEIK